MSEKIILTTQVDDANGTLLATLLANVSAAANAGSNSVATYANGTLILANANLNFIDSSTLVANVSANGTIQANVKFDVNVAAVAGPAYAQANAAYTAANNALAGANTVAVFSNNGLIANGNLNFNNTATANVTVTNNGSSQINIAVSLNTSAIVTAGQTEIFVNGSVVGNSSNLNFVSGNTSNLNITGTQNVTPGNVTITLDTRLVGGGGSGNVANANTTVRGVTLLIDSISSTDNANAATANALSWGVNTINLTAQSAVALAANAWLLANAANGYIYVNGVLVAQNPNLNFVAANTSNLSIVGVSNTSPGNVTISLDTLQSGGGGAYSQTGVLINGTLTANGVNINFVATNTSNLLITGTQNTSPGNVTVSIDTRNPPGSGGGTPGGSNTEIQFNSNSTFGGSVNLTFNVASNTTNIGGTLNVTSNGSNTALVITPGSITANAGKLNANAASINLFAIGAGTTNGSINIATSNTGNIFLNAPSVNIGNSTVGGVGLGNGGILNVIGAIIGGSTLTIGGQANLVLMNVSSRCNISTLNVVTTLAAFGSPLVNAATQVYTGLAAFKTPASNSANATLTVDSKLILTFNETGRYAFEGYLLISENLISTGGFQFDLGSNTAITANLAYTVEGYSNTTILNAAAITTNNSATTLSTVSTSNSAPSWVRFKGSAQITTVGTIGVRWAQASALAANVTFLLENSYFMATKIG